VHLRTGRSTNLAAGLRGLRTGVFQTLKVALTAWLRLGESNVVLTERLYPRRLVGGPETDADHRALQLYADKATYYEEQEVEMRLGQKQDERQVPAR
jgi:hypothetical protein